MGKNTQSNKDIHIILEIQRMEHFFTCSIYAFTLESGVVNEKLIFTVKKICCVYFFIFFFFFSSF